MSDTSTNTKALFTGIVVSPLGDSEVEIKGEIPTETAESYRKKAVEHLSKEVSIDGFRSGHIPESVLIQKVGEMPVLEEMAEMALARAYPEILKEQKLATIGRPAISITKLAKGNPIGFTVRTALFPEFTLPDYTTISSSVRAKHLGEEVAITDEELEKSLLDIRRSIAHERWHRENKTDEHAHGDIKDEDLPPLDAAYVKELGPFETVDAFTTRVKETLLEEKKRRAHDARRAEIADALVSASTIPLPSLLVDSELARMEAEFESQIERMGTTKEQYLTAIKKNADDLQKEWRPEAEKRAKLQLLLNAIGIQENIVPEKEKVEREVKHLMEHYSKADPENLKTYVETLMINDAVFKLLEGKSEEEKK